MSAKLDLSQMTAITLIRLLTLLVAVFYLACLPYGGTAETSNQMNSKIILDINSNGKRIEIKVGDEIQIELKAMGGTGYAWYFEKLDQFIFDLTSEERKGAVSEKGDLVGTPVLLIWKLKAKKPGTSLIRMLYYRSWEGKEKAVNRFEIIVDVSR